MLNYSKHGCFLFLLLIVTPHSLAGKLDNFEKEAVSKSSSNQNSSSSKKSSRSSNSSNNSSSSSSSDGLSDPMVALFLSAVVFLGDKSYERINFDESGNEDTTILPRYAGETLIPFARFDISYQMPERDIYAYDLQTEFGYGQYGINLERSFFYEDIPDQAQDKMKITQIGFLYRMSLSSQLEIDFAVGSYEIAGNSTNSYGYIGFPIKIKFDENFSLEYKTTWADAIKDHELAVYAGWDFAKFKLGYRFLSVGSADLSSPFLGVSFHY